MVLHNVDSVTSEDIKHIQVKDGLIHALSADAGSFNISAGELEIDLHDTIVFPGLINSHDHLDFNLFPQTGNRIYNNYTEWAKDINEHNKASMDTVLQIPKDLRTQYGIYKNLLNGFTTVVNHGEHLAIRNSPITVFQDSYSLHSIHFENNWKYHLNSLFKKKNAFVIHVGEGTDHSSSLEIDNLVKWNLFKRKLVAVHGVSMNGRQAGSFHAVVWCPASNFFLLDSTAPVDQLKNFTQIIFGTDSTLTASWNAWDHLRLARQTKLLDDAELLDAVTKTAAMVWGLNSGSLAENKNADIVVARKKKGLNKMDNFYSLNPEDLLMVMHKGKIRLLDESLLQQFPTADIDHLKKTGIGGKFIEGDMPALMSAISSYAHDIAFPLNNSFA